MLRFAIEAERLPRDVGDTQQLLFPQLREVARFIIERGMIAQQIRRCC